MASKNENIETIGLKIHLDNTRHLHFDLDYDDLILMMDRGVNKSNIARMFGVSRHTLDKWVDIWRRTGA